MSTCLEIGPIGSLDAQRHETDTCLIQFQGGFPYLNPCQHNLYICLSTSRTCVHNKNHGQGRKRDGERERERERQTDRQTNKTETETKINRAAISSTLILVDWCAQVVLLGVHLPVGHLLCSLRGPISLGSRQSRLSQRKRNCWARLASSVVQHVVRSVYTI